VSSVVQFPFDPLPVGCPGSEPQPLFVRVIRPDGGNSHLPPLDDESFHARLLYSGQFAAGIV